RLRRDLLGGRDQRGLHPADAALVDARPGPRPDRPRPERGPPGGRARRPEQRLRLRRQQRRPDPQGLRVTAVAITGWSALTSAGIGPEAVAAALARTNGGLDPGHEVAHLYEQRLPSRTGHALVDFDVRDHLERKAPRSSTAAPRSSSSPAAMP